MIALPLGRCRNCDAPVSYFARTCPDCHAPNLPNPVAAIAALVAVILAGGIVALGVQVFRGKAAPPAPTQAGDTTTTPTDPTTDTAGDYGWIVKAMAECEEEAKIKLDTMYFLIIPVTSTGVALPGWAPSPISTVGSSAALLTSTDALIGLRNRALALYQKPLAFAVSDPATNMVYKWKPAVGVTALKTRESGLSSLTLGFEIPDLAKEIEWGPTINLNKGTCYWINPLLRLRPRSG
jgi:hypothetical protein